MFNYFAHHKLANPCGPGPALTTVNPLTVKRCVKSRSEFTVPVPDQVRRLYRLAAKEGCDIASLNLVATGVCHSINHGPGFSIPCDSVCRKRAAGPPSTMR